MRYIYLLQSFCWSELPTEVMAQTENLKIYNDYWITEWFNYWIENSITELKRLRICFAFIVFRVFVIWVKWFFGAFKRQQVYSIGIIAIYFIAKGATITSIIVIMKNCWKKCRTKVQKVLFTWYKLLS